MSRQGASDRVRRLLSLAPWVAAQADGAPIDDVCRRFEISRKVLLADLDSLMMVGLPPYTPDTYVDVVVDDDRVWITPQWFDRPLRLTPEQALALVAAGRSLLGVPGADPEGPLARGLDKLAAALDVDPAAIEVDLGDADAVVLRELGRACRERCAVRLDYYAYGRDERGDRVVEPWAVFNDQGNWYLQGWCREAEGERVFRVDRVHGVEVLEDEPIDPPADPPSLAVFSPGPMTPEVTLELAPGAAWVIEQYPTVAVEALETGWFRVTLAVTARPWLERLLLRLGPAARVAAAPDGFAGLRAEAAQRVLARYRA